MDVKPLGTGPDLREAHRFAVDAARAAGKVLRAGMRGELHARAKSASGDLVTDLDLAAERLIVDRIRARWPEHGVIAEEGGEYAADDAWAWLVDPLDGTNNVAIGLPAYVVGIALCERGSPVLGVVHDPVAGRTWSAVRGQGAFVHAAGPSGRPLRAPHRPVPSAPVLAWTQGHEVRRDDSTARALKVVLDSTARRVLQLWAPLLSWVMLARGDIDGIVGYRPEAVDLPAGMLLAAEAGMVVRALDGGCFDDRYGCPAERRSFVAGPPESIDRLVKLVTAAQWIEPQVRHLTPISLTTVGW
ncbi:MULTISPECIES: inositol monophosphatase family protein [Micromonospora]|uniref:Histidinol-phosphatase n=1 Tax=Micromonospora sicca TaxID=2202420 RepID=A0A317DTK5_9ACTN|nr:MULTISPECIES: inositol monophosphatase family protein [unclassified Micromonospora]MBM0229801.1 inositol monophosphatase [Micromonospora sp. ATA51]MDZ5443051.1 inositol monophosphatase family protein [Micromonospora sp. 4G57]MDZ5488237.1 inositol monophosphatase family protein [Micromonospora sp. 4G53]PWR16253.1 inositol monophosphatase [Micromonospora sp. 4G51]